MRFTIRDLLWLMVVVGVLLAMGLAWHRDHVKQTQKFDFYYEGLIKDVYRRAEEVGRLEDEIARRDRERIAPD